MIHDNKMPGGWHMIKSVLLKEMQTAANFHLCEQAAGALFHARLIGESIAREMHGLDYNGMVRGEDATPATEEAPDAR